MINLSKENQRALNGPQLRIKMTSTQVLKAYFRLFEKTLSKHAPKIQGTKKNQKLERKLWITKGIKKFMKERDKLDKEMVKAKNNKIKIQKHESYKSFRNK